MTGEQGDMLNGLVRVDLCGDPECSEPLDSVAVDGAQRMQLVHRAGPVKGMPPCPGGDPLALDVNPSKASWTGALWRLHFAREGSRVIASIQAREIVDALDAMPAVDMHCGECRLAAKMMLESALNAAWESGRSHGTRELQRARART